MATTFKVPLNNIRTTLQSSHTSGSGSLAVATGTGVNFGSTFPLRVTVITAASYGTAVESLTIFSVTARATDSLTVTAIEGTSDATYAAGAFVEMRGTAGTISDLNTAVNSLENNISAGAAHSVMLGEGTTAPGFATIGTAGRVLTDNGAGADPSFLALPTSTYVTGLLSSGGSPYTINTSVLTNIGLSITLPVAGTYQLFTAVRILLDGSCTAVNGYNFCTVQLYDTTFPRVVPNSTYLAAYLDLQVITNIYARQVLSAIGPIFYTVTGLTVINLQAVVGAGGTGTVNVGQMYSDANGGTTLSAIRVS